MVHASMRRVGTRAEDLVAALDTVVGPDGTLLMTLGADPDAGPFDAAATPADPDIGVLAEVFRTTSGTVVSDHPEGRFGARGACAAALVDDVPWDDYYGPGSPLERFVAINGRVLRLGADPDTVTLYHWAEYLADIADKIRVVRTPLVRRADGTVAPVRVECLDDSDGIAEWDGPDYFGIITDTYVASGRATVGRVGNARAEVFDAVDVVPFAVAWMESHLSRRATDRPAG
jgi:aminoglycoside N3'-acetyltransferase